jgi:diguanylate cyclase (GGDEF)-like protein
MTHQGGSPIAPERDAPAASARVLLVEHDPRTALLIGELLRAGLTPKPVITQAERLIDATRELLEHRVQCVLLSLEVGAGDPLSPLERLRNAAPDVPIVVLADQPDDTLGVAAVRAGAQDFLVKPQLAAAPLARAVAFAIERKRSEVELAHQALHDPLTGLPNRALFLDRLSVALDRSRRTGARIAVLFLDVDHFKLVNDSMGHAAGDKLLNALADRFRKMLRPMDTVARFGGDEFTFLFEELESEREAVLIASRIRKSAGEPLTLGGDETRISVSIGITIVTDPAVVPDAALRDADVAMYRAKELGGDRFELFDQTSRERATQRLELEDSLRRAIERSELRVHYQPRVSLSSGTGLTGFEAFVRWEHPERGLIDAGQFLALAEDTGLIVPIGEWVIDQALRRAAEWRRSRPGVTISVNLSSRQLEDPGLVSSLAAAIRSSGADPGTLYLEVTEDTLEANPEAAARMLSALHQLGVKLVIDDFGMGHSSVQSLRDLPLDTLKIHESFVAGLDHQPEETALVGALVELGHALGLTVVAEGVESDQQLAQLKRVGCDGAQGYLFSRPVPEDGVGALLRTA